MRIVAVLAAVLLSSSCAGGRLDGGAPEGRWKISEVGGQGLAQESELDFDGAGRRLGIYAGCNRLSADYEADDGNIRFGHVVSTLMACPETAAADAEERISRALEKASAFRIRDGVLFIEDGGRNVLLRAVRVEGKPPAGEDGRAIR